MTSPFDRRRTLIASLTVLAISAALFLPLPHAAAAPLSRELTVTARNFGYEPATLELNHGDTVTLRFESADALHGLFIDGYEVDLQAAPGTSATAAFTADRAGTFRFRCSVSCGALHPFMIGEMRVSPNLLLARAVGASLIAAVGALAFFWRATG